MSTRGTKALLILSLSFGLLVPQMASARDWYVSISRGKGKKGTKEKPAKDIGNLVSKLKAGDVVHIAGGVYLGRGKSGSTSINVPIKVLGGYDETFAKRDPWGAHKTIMTGIDSIKGSTSSRLIFKCRSNGDILVDGLIIDNGPRNYYKNDKGLLILRKANPKLGKNATPESGGLRVDLGRGCNLTVQNTVVMNTAPTGGALQIWGGDGSKLKIHNNLIINNTGEGIYAMTKWHPRDGKGKPTYEITNNTILFNWKHDAIASYGGNSLKLEPDTIIVAKNNVFGFGDYGGVDNIKKCKNLTLKDNLFTGHRQYDYREFNTTMIIDDLEDEADLLSDDTGDNLSKKIKVPVSKKWAELYANRKEISRAAVDAAAKASNSDANALRGMLGLPLQAGAVKMDAEVWLHKMTVEEALKAGEKPYFGKYGCKKP